LKVGEGDLAVLGLPGGGVHVGPMPQDRQMDEDAISLMDGCLALYMNNFEV
jgi:hypothetical protein